MSTRIIRNSRRKIAKISHHRNSEHIGTRGARSKIREPHLSAYRHSGRPHILLPSFRSFFFFYFWTQCSSLLGGPAKSISDVGTSYKLKNSLRHLTDPPPPLHFTWANKSSRTLIRFSTLFIPWPCIE